jgi:hypothetical protein
MTHKIPKIKKRLRRKYRSPDKKNYILSALLIAHKNSRFGLSDKQRTEIVNQAKKDYSAACKAAEKGS